VDLQIVAAFAAALMALAAAFQLGLAAGAPWGAVAYGGRAATADDELPVAYRVSSGVAALVLLGAIWVVLASVSIVGRGPTSPTLLTVILWCLVALFGLNTLANARGRHPLERWGAGSVTAVLTVLCALMAAR
jgi:hypothetical protein